jgi:hypothetical protein
MFLGLLDPDPFVRGTDPAVSFNHHSKNSKKKLDSYCFVTSLWVVDGLKVNDENSRIQSRIRIHWSEARIRGSGSVPKCHGSATLAGVFQKRTKTVFLNIYFSTCSSNYS